MYWIIAISIIVFIVLLLSFTKTALKIRALAKTSKILHDTSLRNENLLIEPYWGSFRGATEKYGKIKCDGIIALTDKNLVFEKIAGDSIEIPVRKIVSSSMEKSFLGESRPGQDYLVLCLDDGTQVGFIVKDANEWMRHLPEKKN